MVDNIERRPEVQKPPEGVTERQEEFPVPEKIQDIAKSTPTQVKTQVTDDSGQPLIQTPVTKQVVIQIPADPTTLDNLSKGEPTSAITWLATFFLRILKKAKHFGWKIVKGEGI